MSARFPFDTSIERGDDEIELRVVYSVTPFVAATYWQPAEGGEVEIISATFTGVDAANMPAPLTDAEEAALLTECEERAQNDLANEEAEAADWKYQEYRDRLLDARASVPDRAVVPLGSSQQAVSPVPASIPSADVIAEIIAHLGAAVMQSIPSDDKIIMGHVRSALDMARLLRSAR